MSRNTWLIINPDVACTFCERIIAHNVQTHNMLYILHKTDEGTVLFTRCIHSAANVLVFLSWHVTVSNQSNLTYRCIATTHGQFNCIRQVSLMCTAIWHNASWAQPTPLPKQQLNWFSHFCTAHDRQCLYFTRGRPNPPKLLPAHGWIWTPV